MKCPVCTEAVLVMADRQGIEIDYCPACRGVWLDRGELDKIIERSTSTRSASDPVASEHRELRSQGEEAHHDDYRKRKKKSFLGELFDFD